MRRYIYLLILVLIGVGQVSWGGFLLTPVGIIPLQIVYLWSIRPQVNPGTLPVYAFLGGLIIDLMGSAVLGTHTLATLFSVWAMVAIESPGQSVKWGYRVVSLIAGITVYLITINLISWCCIEIR